MSTSAVQLAYDPGENIIWMSFPSEVELNTRQQIAEHFGRVVKFWRAKAGGKKTYFVVNFDNVTINAGELEFYAEQTKRAHELCAIASVRYGGNPLQRTVTRLAGMKIHMPSNIYETREEALAVVRKLKAGELAAEAR
jgi:hypothetical protein